MPTLPGRNAYALKRRSEARRELLALRVRLWTLPEPTRPPVPEDGLQPWDERQWLEEQIAEKQAVIDEVNKELSV